MVAESLGRLAARVATMVSAAIFTFVKAVSTTGFITLARSRVFSRVICSKRREIGRSAIKSRRWSSILETSEFLKGDRGTVFGVLTQGAFLP